MFDLNKIVRQNIRELKAYESARSRLNLNEYTLLDSNENPFGSYNRYPDNNHPRLKKLGFKKHNEVINIFKKTCLEL